MWAVGLSLVLIPGLGFLVLATRRMLRELRESRIKHAVDEARTGFSGRLIDPELARYLAAHVYGRSVRRRFKPDDYPDQDAVKCLTCGHEFIGGQFFWDTPLLDRQTLAPVGKSFQICMSCQPGDVEAITRGQ
jgi:hypothetical protein